MKTLTMVMRTTKGSKKLEESVFILIDQDYNFHTLSGAEIVKGIASKSFEVTNMAEEDIARPPTDGRDKIHKVRGLVVNNGSVNRYTTVDGTTGQLTNKPTGVVLNRVEAGGKLLGYTIFTPEGTLAEIDVATAVRLHTAGAIANSKLRSTSSGEIIQSIRGNYPLRKIEIPKKTVGKTEINILFLGSAFGNGKSIIKYGGVIVNSESAADFTKILPSLNDLNNKLINGVISMGAEDGVRETLATKRTGSSGVYTILPYSKIVELAGKENTEVGILGNSLMIACTDYDEDGTESNITVTKDFKVKSTQNGTKKSDANLKKYVKEVQEKFKLDTKGEGTKRA